MKVQEFVEKYGVDYNTVYNATGEIPFGRMVTAYSRDYEEADLKEAVIVVAKRRREKALGALARAEDVLHKCGEQVF